MTCKCSVTPKWPDSVVLGTCGLSQPLQIGVYLVACNS